MHTFANSFAVFNINIFEQKVYDFLGYVLYFSYICINPNCCRGERNKHKGSKWYFQDDYIKMLGK